MDDLVGRDFVVVEWEDPGGTGWIAPQHVHHADDEAWVVLEGTLHFRVGDRELDVGAGSGVLVPAGTPHAFGAFTSERTRYLLILTPRIHALVTELHGHVDDMHALFRRYDSELL